MIYEEALELAKGGLKTYYETYPELADQIEFQKTVIEALEKQISKKPFRDDHTVIKYCPNCKRQLRTFISVESQSFHGYERETLHANYCENCGQAIDWGEL